MFRAALLHATFVAFTAGRSLAPGYSPIHCLSCQPLYLAGRVTGQRIPRRHVRYCEGAAASRDVGVPSDDSLAQRWAGAGRTLSGIAILGAVECGYLTSVKLGQIPLSCPTDNGLACSQVLNSQWASVGPVPLAAFGLAAYLTVAFLGFKSTWARDEALWLLVLTMACVSAALMGILVFVLKIPCVFCVASAFLSALLLSFVEVGRSRTLGGSQGQPRRAVVGLSGVVTLGAARAATLRPEPGEDSYAALTEIYKPDHPPVRSNSSRADIALAKYLKSIGAACYTAWWCPHCQEQREAFGAEAVKFAPIVECSSVDRVQKQTCAEKEITGYPMWIINGKKYRGGKELGDLANISGFQEFPEDAFEIRNPEITDYIWK